MKEQMKKLTNYIKNKDKKQVAFQILLFYLIASLVALIIVMLIRVNDLQNVTKFIKETDDINGQTQRLVRMEMSKEFNDELIQEIEILLQNLESHDREIIILEKENNATDIYYTKMLENWECLKEEIIYAREVGWEASEISSVAEKLYYTVTNLLEEINSYMKMLAGIIQLIQYLIIFYMSTIMFCFFVRFIYYVRILQVKEVQVEKSYIDLATGIFNRRKCEEFFIETSIKVHVESMLVVLDINNLKKINDTLGHIYGDELIADFAKLLKKSSDEFGDNPFVGRYGGDEFVVFFKESSEEEIQEFYTYLQETVDEYNLDNTDFQISYARGHASSKSLGKIGVAGELFMEADEKMYQNKKIVKNRINY